MEAAPIDGCTGMVLDNLEEDTTLDDIKNILKKVCPDESLQSCTLHPTGSLRSKIIQNIDASIIPALAKKVDKSSFKGRLIYCKPYVPKTPPKKDIPSSGNDGSDSALNHSTSKQEIPGLPEEERIKALKPKEKKVRKAKEAKKVSKEDNLNMKNLSQKDFLLIPNASELSKDFVFNDDDEDDLDDFEDSREEPDEEAFTTPLTLKSRSGSTSVKRQHGSEDAENEHKKKSLKSGNPAVRNSLSK